MSDLQITYRPLEALIPYARNSRTHSERQVAQIAASIRAFGWTNPILVDGENGVIAGHGRLLAARKLGWCTVPVVELAHLTSAQKRAYLIADNKLAERAGWETELLALELGEIQAEGFDLSLIGFEAVELEALRPADRPNSQAQTQAAVTLAERFLMAPFSVLNAREGRWQERKRAWRALGIRSEEGRAAGLNYVRAFLATAVGLQS